MQLKQLPDLRRPMVIYDSDFVFDAHNSNKSELITRYRGTILKGNEAEDVLVSWQKSIYHFGGITREVPIFIYIRLNKDGVIKSVEIDERSNGSQGKKCSFPCLESCISSTLKNKNVKDICTYYPSAVETKCLHIFEILAAASSFYTFLKQQRLEEGKEQELFTITPSKTGLVANNRHEVFDKQSETEFVFNHISAPILNSNNLTEKLDSFVHILYNSSSPMNEILHSDNFESTYAQLNRVMSKCYHLEKKFFGFSGRIKFTNFPAMVGLILLSLSHESINGKLSRAIEIEKILHYLQTGYGDHPCKGFGG